MTTSKPSTRKLATLVIWARSVTLRDVLACLFFGLAIPPFSWILGLIYFAGTQGEQAEYWVRLRQQFEDVVTLKPFRGNR